jgi:hypothetical protein
MEEHVFGEVIKEPWSDVLEQMGRFLAGYPQETNGSTSNDSTRIFSFKHDMNWIVLAIRNQCGIDLTYRREELFHWWEFLLEFQSLAGDHYISKIMQFRGYQGEDREYRRIRDSVALPAELSAEDQKALDEFNALFD